MNPTSQNFLKSLKENWFLIVFIGGLIIGWTRFDSRLSVQETAIVDQKAKFESLMNSTQTLTAAVIEIKANYIFIKETLTELKNENR